MNKTPALINERDVCTDWIEDVFDNMHCVECGKQALGFVNDAPVRVNWDGNHIYWRIIETNINNYDKTLNEIRNRLTEWDDQDNDLLVEYDIVPHCCIKQSFYFKE